MATKISPLSEVHPSAELADDVQVGPFCLVGPNVRLGPGCRLMNHVSLIGQVHAGRENVFFPSTVIGADPQDLKYRGAATRIEIGDRNTFREQVTVHPGTEAGGEVTRVGSDSLFMIGSHVAHDCLLDDAVMLGNYCQLAGHVRIETHAVVSALSGVHHFVTLGRHSFVGGLTAVKRDIPPFTIFYGSPGEIRGVNEVGMGRNGMTPEQIAAVKAAYRKLFGGGNDQCRQLELLEADPGLGEDVRYLCQFLRASQQGKFGRFRETLREQGDKTAWAPGALGQQG